MGDWTDPRNDWRGNPIERVSLLDALAVRVIVHRRRWARRKPMSETAYRLTGARRLFFNGGGGCWWWPTVGKREHEFNHTTTGE